MADHDNKNNQETHYKEPIPINNHQSNNYIGITSSAPTTNFGLVSAQDFVDPAKRFDFSEFSIRQAFVRKVYLLLMCQQLITLILIGLFSFNDTRIQAFIEFQYNPILILILIFILLIMFIVMECCSRSLLRRTPYNYIFLWVFTFLIAILLGIITVVFQTDSILIGIIIITILFGSCSIFTLQNKWDFKLFYCMIFIGIIIGIIFIIGILLKPNRLTVICTAAISTALFCLWTIYDTEMIITYEHDLCLYPEEYIFAVLTFYMDIVHILLKVCRVDDYLFGGDDDD